MEAGLVIFVKLRLSEAEVGRGRGYGFGMEEWNGTGLWIGMEAAHTAQEMP